MKIDFPLPIDNKKHEYCIFCHHETIHKIDGEIFECSHCGKSSPRVIAIDPEIVYWVDEKTKDYWHESVGIILRNEDHKILFFKRTIYPQKYSIPAGHLDIGETQELGARRELREETGVDLQTVRLFTREEIAGDECRRGSDHHLWNLYVADVKNNIELTINNEGVNAVWLSVAQAKEKDLVYPLRFLIEKYGEQLVS